ncbi:MAG: septal ring lytic transglycosylase RlpA family protein [Candidatus Lernaella stagnicola]|nr:septal ring lytic transglycosylase RlpA family protein [Candidatus Lernaella stagnicola]
MWLFIVGFLLAASGCATTSRTPAGFETGGDWYETGIASWYGERFQGRRTASGEPFNYHKLTAAHRSLPFGTYVEVQRVDNGRSVVVRINDRGPFVRGRIIDVSKAAAERLDMLRAGVVEVRIRIVRPAH